ncbi:hypothetical protein GGI15_004057 [Coemansia interrupta]|uniref:molybdopterin adenylyltransferase n=1 Tax=Coemansia interrupta TaxID=1126814 RepID=A0A9W8HAZ7_9FUNG|nr:hypothetical protein GGI15_004057 [Coemansia interrupta]
MPLFPVGILTVSDKCSQGLAQDTSGPALRTLLESRTNSVWQVTHTHVVPDEQHEISSTVQQWSAHCRLVVVSGGTGIAEGDVTVGALEPLFTKRLPSLAIAMVVGSLRITPKAALSQVTAGVVGRCVVVAVPGSKKGSVENLEQIVDVLPHAVDIAGAGRSTRQLHEGAGGLCGCSRPDDGVLGEQPSAGSVAGRARKSPYRMVPVDDALQSALACVDVLAPETVALADVRPGMVLAEPVVAREPVPAYAASVMDGYAVVAADGPGEYRVLGASTAGGEDPAEVTSGTVVRIATGAPVPRGADAVVMVEDTELVEQDAGGEEVRIRVLAQVKEGQHVRPVGYDVQAGSELLPKGARVSSVGGEVGTMALSGNPHFRVHGRPRIAVMSTGDELLAEPSGVLTPGAVRDSNRPALLCALRAMGCMVDDLGVVPDDPERLAYVMKKALLTCHGIVTSGGVSMGERDCLRLVIEQHLGGRVVFGRVMMKPAKPTTFAALPQGRFVFGLPGNPASAVVALHMFAAPVVRKMMGHGERVEQLRPSVRAVLRGPRMVLDRLRPEYVRARLEWDAQETAWVARVNDARQQSSRMANMLDANALVVLPCGTDAQPAVNDGDRVTAIIIAPPSFGN